MSNTLEIIKKQLAWEPNVTNAQKFDFDSVVVGGMGGSAFAADSLSWLGFEKQIVVHRGYDLPQHVFEHALFVAVSHSGNTEETLSFAHAVLEKGAPLAIVTSGGKLLDIAKTSSLCHALVPADFAPRDSILYHARALGTLFGKTDTLNVSHVPSESTLKMEAERIAHALFERVPLMYASMSNELIARLWNVILNETAKVPAFHNVFPEFNHNEIQGIDPMGPLGKRIPFIPIVLEDGEDDTRIAHRLRVFTETMEKRGVSPLVVPTMAEGRAARFVWHFALSREVAHLLAEAYGVEADAVPLIEEFKNRLTA